MSFSTSTASSLLALCLVAGSCVAAEETRWIDCSLIVDADYPCTWPADPFPRFRIWPQRRIGPDSPYNVDVLLIDGNTGTQLDVPPHSVARSHSTEFEFRHSRSRAGTMRAELQI
jgi:hypothetical protein